MKKIILICSLFILFGCQKKIAFPMQGEFVFGNDESNNCTLILDEYSYSFVGEGDIYENLVNHFKEKGKIKHVENYRGYFDMYLLTNDSNGPYISFEEDGTVIFTMGIAYSDSYRFYKK